MQRKATAAVGRHFTTRERSNLVAAYPRLQLTQREFAEQHGISLATLARWLRQERDGPVSPRRKRPVFAEVPLAGGLRWAAEVVRPDGWTVRLAGAAPAALVEQLLRPC